MNYLQTKMRSANQFIKKYFQNPKVDVSGTEDDQQSNKLPRPTTIPIIELPDFVDFNTEEPAHLNREDSIIELQQLELCYDIQSVSSNSDSDSVVNVPPDQPTTKVELTSKLSRTREPANGVSDAAETTLSVVVEKAAENGEKDETVVCEQKEVKPSGESVKQQQTPHSGIVLSPLQLGQ